MNNPYLKKKPLNEVEESSSSKVEKKQPQSAQHDDVPADSLPKESASALIISASAKAGMEGMDRTRMDEIILRESGNSKFMQQQRRRDAKVNLRIEGFQQRKRQATPSDYAVTPALEKRLHTWQAAQATRATCVVVDMDMFYMACELLDKPHLKDVPACVGRGMILTSNYPARKFGVRSAMPGWIGDKLVEELSNGNQRLVHVPANFDLYKQKSVQVVEVLKEFDPDLKSYSLDEAYMDLGPYLAQYLQQLGPRSDPTTRSLDGSDHTDECQWDHARIRQTLIESHDAGKDYVQVLRGVSSYTCRKSLERVVRYMRSCVERATGGLTCSAGMAPNFSLAKIASDKNKPNGQCFVDPSEVLEFIRPLPVRKIPGIGRVTEKILNACEIATVQDLYDQRGLVNWLFPPVSGEFLLKASVGCMGSSTSKDLEDDEDGSTNNATANDSDHQKGISRERTFQPNDNWTDLNIKLEDIAHMLSQDMSRKKVLAHTVTVKVKLDNFDVYSRSKSMGGGVYIQSRHELIALVAPLFAQIRSEHLASSQSDSKRSFSCRLLGIRCSNLVEESEFSHAQQETLDRFLSKSLSPRSARSDRRAVFVSAQPLQHEKGAKPMDAFLSKVIPTVANVRLPSQEVATTVISTSGGREMESKSTSDATLDAEKVECPLCQRRFPLSENVLLNSHIDTCLNGTAVRQVVRDNSAMEALPKKRQRLTDWWCK